MRIGKRTWPAIAIALAIHTLTASGAGLGLLALLSAARQDWNAAFLWLGLALVVDGIDGPLARAAKVTSVLPRFSGERLDLIVDYLNYCLVPAYIFAVGDRLPPALAWPAGIAVAVVSLFHFADVRSKTADDCFVGFPALWNVVALYLFVLDLRGAAALLVIAGLCVLTFVPIKWPHPLRTERLRAATMAVTALWCVAAAVAIGRPPPPFWVQAVFAAAALYMAAAVALLTATGSPRRRSEARGRGARESLPPPAKLR